MKSKYFGVGFGAVFGLCVAFCLGASTTQIGTKGIYQASDHFVIDTRTGKVVTWVLVPQSVRNGQPPNPAIPMRGYFYPVTSPVSAPELPGK